MFGYGAEARRRDKSARSIRPRFVDPQARVAFIERLASEGAVTDYLLRLRRVDNSPLWVEVTAHADPPADDGSVRIDALVRDVSERKKLEDQTRDLYHQLLQAEKLAALGQTISGVAHELNNPLATILTWAERLSQRPVDDKTKRGLETILSESERAAKIVRNLLTFARKRQSTRDDGRPQPRGARDARRCDRTSSALPTSRSSTRWHQACRKCLPTRIRFSRCC